MYHEGSMNVVIRMCTQPWLVVCGVGSMFLVDSSLVQLFVSSNFSVLTMYVYSCHTSLTVMPLSVYV